MFWGPMTNFVTHVSMSRLFELQSPVRERFFLFRFFFLKEYQLLSNFPSKTLPENAFVGTGWMELAWVSHCRSTAAMQQNPTLWKTKMHYFYTDREELCRTLSLLHNPETLREVSASILNTPPSRQRIRSGLSSIILVTIHDWRSEPRFKTCTCLVCRTIRTEQYYEINECSITCGECIHLVNLINNGIDNPKTYSSKPEFGNLNLGWAKTIDI